jgi:hypothetical protein
LISISAEIENLKLSDYLSERRDPIKLAVKLPEPKKGSAQKPSETFSE